MLRQSRLWLGLLSLSFLSLGASSMPPDLQRITTRGKLMIATLNSDVPPFFMHDAQGKLTGYEVELAEDIAKKFNVRLEWLRTAKSFDEVVVQIADGKADLGLANLSKTVARAKLVRFSRTYLSQRQVLLVNRLIETKLPSGKTLDEYLDANNMRFGIAALSSYVDFMKFDFPNAQVRQFINTDQLMDELIAGNLQAGLLDESTVNNWLRAHPESTIKMKATLRQGRSDPLAIAVNWKDEQLLGWINVYIENYLVNGTAARLKKRYLQLDPNLLSQAK